MTIRAYSTLVVKALDEDKRVIRGIASTPTADRMDDIVEPKGAEFKLPLPFLWQHDQRQPIGHVTKATVTDAGIEVEVQLAQIDAPGTLRDRLEEAWQSIKAGLVRGLSIGFQPLESSEIQNSWGRRFTKWSWFELSAVTIPANAEANILSVKSFDQQQRAASGIKAAPVVRFAPPAGATAIPTQKSAATFGADMTIQEQLAAAREQRRMKGAQLADMMTKSGETGATLDTDGQAKFDAIDGEIKSLDSHIGRLERAEAVLIETAKPVGQTKAAEIHREAGVQPGKVEPQAKAAPLKDGLAMAQYVKMLGRAKGIPMQALEFAKQYQGIDARVVEMLKSAVSGATTTDATWSSPLVQQGGPFADFVEYLRPQTIVGRFGAGGVPGLRRVPFRVPLIGQTSPGSAYWVGEAAGKPLTAWDYEKKQLDPLKIAAICVLSNELIQDSSPAADALARDELVMAARNRMDVDFIDPAKAAVANISPASITNGVTPISASGTTADDARSDVKSVMTQFLLANNAPSTGVWIMDSVTALGLTLLLNPLGQREFPDISISGGSFMGFPVIVSDNVVRDSAGGSMILVNASDIYFGDNGDFTVDMSTEASLQMDNAPTQNSATPTATSVVSMWQTNSTAFRVERRLNWMRRRAVSVAWVDGTNYGG